MIHEVSADFAAAVQNQDRVSGLTHGFYRYPARFSPVFVRAAVQAFTKPGDLVFDPFMGGGTTLVEATAMNRHAAGTDLNSLSVFVSKVKTTVLSTHDLREVQAWGECVTENLNLHEKATRHVEWIERGYQRNISSRVTWPIRKFLEMSLNALDLLSTDCQRSFARCVLLKTAQWAFDCRVQVPPIRQFRQQLRENLAEMIGAAQGYADAVSATRTGHGRERAVCLHRSVVGAELDPTFRKLGAPRLILTSPPYPGVHVLYHRWQVQGRRETPAPYWIANTLDGDGTSFYNFGNRRQPGLTDYFQSAERAFRSVAAISDRKTIIVQMIAFSDAAWQLPEYLCAMDRAGLSEVRITALPNTIDGRLWRDVPNRKFYADQKGATASSKEVVLFHRLQRD